jgi:hypothetical protein
MMVTSCPFCGVGTDLPHETQEACIAALHAEVMRMRQVVSRLNGAPSENNSDTPTDSRGPVNDRR